MCHAAAIPTEGLSIYQYRLLTHCLKRGQMFCLKWKGFTWEQCPVCTFLVPIGLRNFRISTALRLFCAVLDAPPFHDCMNECIMTSEHQWFVPNDIIRLDLGRSGLAPGFLNLINPLLSCLLPFGGFSNFPAGVECTLDGFHISDKYICKTPAGLDEFSVVLFFARNDKIWFESLNLFDMKAFCASNNGDFVCFRSSAHTKLCAPFEVFAQSKINQVFGPTWDKADNSHGSKLRRASLRYKFAP